MRVSSLGIFGARHSLTDVARWAEQDAALAHPHRVCRQANALYAMAIADAVHVPGAAEDVHRRIAGWAEETHADAALVEVVEGSATTPPPDYVTQQGWVLIAFQNALWQLLHAPILEEAVVDTVMRGHRHQPGDLRGAPRCSAWPVGGSRTMGRLPARMPPRSKAEACRQAPAQAVLADRRIGIGGGSDSPLASCMVLTPAAAATLRSCLRQYLAQVPGPVLPVQKQRRRSGLQIASSASRTALRRGVVTRRPYLERLRIKQPSGCAALRESVDAACTASPEYRITQIRGPLRVRPGNGQETLARAFELAALSGPLRGGDAGDDDRVGTR